MVKWSDYQEVEVQACFSVLLQKLSWWSSLVGWGDNASWQKHLAKEGLEKIKAKFATVETIGPVWVADFLEISDSEERARVQREAFELVDALTKELDIAFKICKYDNDK